MSSNISAGIGSASDSLPDVILSILTSLINGGRVESSSDLSLLSIQLRDSDSKFPSSNYVNVIIFPVCSFEDVEYGMYNTAGLIAIVFEYGHDEYAKSLEKSRQKKYYTKLRSCVCGVCKQDTLFDAV